MRYDVFLTKAFSNLSKLEILELSDNNLTTLPDSIGGLVFLRTLYFINNKITQIPKSISKLKDLKILY